MKSHLSSIKKKLVPAFIIAIFTALLLGYFGLSFYILHSNDQHNRAVIKTRASWLEMNKDKLMYIYTDVFPRAKECNENGTNKIRQTDQNCEPVARQLIDDNLASTLSYENGWVGRLPIFFIRLKNKDTIEKLYQDGNYYEENVDTQGEKMVVQMLQGKRDPFAYPQYNCCGGDDITPEIPIFSLFLPSRIYLKDFYTEIEHIYLIRNEKDEIVGGLVYLYGD